MLKCRWREMFGYATDLRSRTEGRAMYTMQFDSYQQVPESIAEEIVKASSRRVTAHRRLRVTDITREVRSRDCHGQGEV